jgi:predicted ArsR family transcriptional regulator
MNSQNSRRSGPKKQLLSSTRGRMLVLLCRGRKTVNELAAALGITDNAVRAQLQRFQRDGFARPAGSRSGVRKPHVEYELTDKARQLFPRAYEPMLQTLMGALQDQLPQKTLQALLSEAGRRLVNHHLGELRQRSPRQRLVEIMSKLNGASLGIELADDSAKTVIRSCSCPLASVTAAHPQLCEVFAGVLGELLRANVRERCEKGESPRCCFEISHAPQ